MEVENSLTIDRDSGIASFTVPESVHEAWSLYVKSPLVQSVIDRELHARQEHVHEVEPRSSHYAVKGILHELAGESFEVPIDEVIGGD